MLAPSYEKSVFINCPFDSEYRPFFEAIVFTVHDCGRIARCSLEIDDSSQVRIDKVMQLIEECRYGIHDISRTELDSATRLPRFNMPLELGVFLGAKRFGRAQQREKVGLVLDRERYRYQKFISDIAGQDIAAHGSDVNAAIRIVRDWIRSTSPRDLRIPGGAVIARRYHAFRARLPTACAQLRIDVDELTFGEFVLQVEEWLKLNEDVPA